MASNDTIENDCSKALSQQGLFDLGCLAPALALILVLASLKQRTKFKLEWFDGRPGLLIPVDFLGSHSNRWTVVATYGATASAMLALLIGNGGIIVFESPWLKSCLFNLRHRYAAVLFLKNSDCPRYHSFYRGYLLTFA